MAAYKVVDAEQLDADLTTVADAIREKTGGTDLLSFPDGMASGVDAVYEAGEKAVYDAFWDAYQDGGNRTDYSHAFRNGWNQISYRPKYRITANTCVQMFSQSAIPDTLVVIDCTACEDMNQTFADTSSLTTIRELLVSENTKFNAAFADCTNLVNLTIGGTIGQNGLNLSWSPGLTKASLTSIINALSSSAAGLTVTLSLAAVNNAFETEGGAADGSASEEWLALAASKSNWTVSLV